MATEQHLRSKGHHCLREFVKTSVILTPSSLLVGASWAGRTYIHIKLPIHRHACCYTRIVFWWGWTAQDYGSHILVLLRAYSCYIPFGEGLLVFGRRYKLACIIIPQILQKEFDQSQHYAYRNFRMFFASEEGSTNFEFSSRWHAAEL